MADGTWKPVGDVQVGDTVVGFAWEEGRPCRLLPARVSKVFRRQAGIVVVRLASGRAVRCTADHWWYTGSTAVDDALAYQRAYPGGDMVWVCEPGEYRQAIMGELMPQARDRVVKIKPLGGQVEVVALQTATGNYIGQGYASRNCFSDNLIPHREGTARPVGQTSLRTIEHLFAGEPGVQLDLWREALRYDRKRNGYPCPVQLGALTDPCDNIERQQGWLLKYIDLAIKYNQPTRISTKGDLFLLPEYLNAVARAPHLFWVAFSIITPDDELIARIDRRMPNASRRLETMAALSRVGVKTALRFRPILPGVSDRTRQYPQAYKVLVERAAQAGACAVSMEAELKWRWQRLSKLAGVPFMELYRQFGPTMACMRPPYTWTENIMHAIVEHAHACGLVVGVSDPVWKQLSDTGCCCGILPDDPVFGNWQEESATNQLLLARDTGKLLRPEDVIPSWAYKASLNGIAPPGVGPKAAWKHRHVKWADRLRAKWNDLTTQRGPLNYFQGALVPDHIEPSGDVVYRYEGLRRQYPPATPYWSV